MTFTIPIKGTVSTLNSTSTVLTASATYTGTAEDVQSYASVTVSVVSNVASAAGGFKVQFSTDGTNWDFVTSMDIVAGVPNTDEFEVSARYFRVVFQNGSTAQTSFRLQSLLRPATSLAAVTSSSG